MASSDDLFKSLYSSGMSVAGARGTQGKGVPTLTQSGGSAPSALPLMTQQPEKKKEEQQSSSSSTNYQNLLNSGSTTPAAGTTGTGSNLVSGTFGSSTYAPTGFGLQGASAGMTYGGGTAAGLGASSGLIGSAGGATAGGATGGAGFGLGGSLVGGSGTVGGSTFAAGSGGAAAGGGASAGGGLAAAGPWAALAAAIIGNESYQKKKGNRSEGSKYWTDLISGNKIVERDADTLGEKIDSGNKLGLKGDWQVAGDITSFDFSNAAKGLKDTFGVKTIKKLFGG